MATTHHIVSRDGNDFNAYYHIVSRGGDDDNASAAATNDDNQRRCPVFECTTSASHESGDEVYNNNMTAT